MLQKILLAIGGSPDSTQVLASGLTLAEKLGAKVLILHVLDPLLPPGLSAVESPFGEGGLPIINDQVIEQYLAAQKDCEQQGINRLQAYATQANALGLSVDILQNYGDSGPLICETAKNWSADMIVMGRNQKSILSEVFVGSTSNYVVHHASCAVIVIQLPVRLD